MDKYSYLIYSISTTRRDEYSYTIYSIPTTRRDEYSYTISIIPTTSSSSYTTDNATTFTQRRSNARRSNAASPNGPFCPIRALEKPGRAFHVSCFNRLLSQVLGLVPREPLLLVVVAYPGQKVF